MSGKKREIQAANASLAKQIAKEGAVPIDMLRTLLRECDEKGLSLGQVLLQKHYLNTAKLAAFMRSLNEQKTTVAAMSPSKPVEIGAKYFGDYLILSEIARGGMGIVYRARQKGMDRIVALKILISGPMSDNVQIRRFFREAKVISALNHPNIIPLYAMGEYGGRHFFTMKCVEGGTFSEMLEKQAPLEEKLTIIAKVCRALDHAHNHKILHRDLKPSNVLLDRDNTPYLTDFGLAKVVDSKSALTQTGSVLGTPFYMSPEQTSGKKRRLDRRSDVYSMGVVLYQALTGQLPFVAEALPELYLKINHEEPAPPRKITPSIPQDLEAICSMAMEKSPAFRYRDAKSMAEDLERFLAGRKVYARRLKIKADLARFYRRNRKKVGAGLLVAALFALVAVLGYWLYQNSENEKDFQARANLRAVEICEQAEKMFSAGERNKALKMLRKKSKKLKNYRVYLELASCYQRLERSEDARRAYNRAFLLAPENSRVLYDKSEFHRRVGEFAKALELIDAYLAIMPDSSAGYRRRAEIFQQIGNPRAQQDIARANELEKRRLEKRLEEAKECGKQGQKKLALSRLEKLLDENPQYEKAYLLRANLYSSLGEYNQALRDISQAIELNPLYRYRKLKTHLLQQAGYLDETRNCLKELLPEAKADERQELLVRMGDIELKLKNYPQAYECYTALSLNIKATGKMRVHIGQAALETGRLEIAADCLGKASKDATLSGELRGEAYFYLGQLYRQQKNEKRTRKMLKKAIELNAPQSANACLLLGRDELYRKKYKRALKYLKRAAQTFCEDAQLSRELGECYVKTENFKAAQEAFSVCISLEPWNPDYHYQRAMACTALARYAQAQRDLIVCMHLRPEDSAAMVQLLDNMLKDNLVGNYPKMRLFMKNYGHLVNSVAKPDPFDSRWKKLSRDCIQRAMALRGKNDLQMNWDRQEAQTLLNALMGSESPSVHRMARTGLFAMYKSPKLYAMLAAATHDKKYLDSAKRRLRKLENELSQKYLGELKVEFRHLLVRYYQGREAGAIDRIYEAGKIRKRCLAAMLADEGEDVMIRFLAAQALRDLRTRACYRVLTENTVNGSPVAKLFASVVLLQENKHFTETKNCFQKAPALKPPYARAIAALYMPPNREILSELLKDPELRVRLCAASRLRCFGDRNAENELLEGISPDNAPLVRAYSIAVYWDFSSARKQLSSQAYHLLRERAQKQTALLAKASRDEDVRVRRIALLSLAKLDAKAHTPVIAKHLHDKDPLIRFMALRELSRKMETRYIIPILTDAQQPLAYRIAAMDGMSTANRVDDRYIPTDVLVALMPVLHDPDPRVRMVMVIAIGKIKTGKKANFLKNYVQQNKSDPAVISGYLLSIISDRDEAKNISIAHLQTFFRHSDAKIRSLAASCAVYAALVQKSSQISQLQERLLESDVEIRKGGAMGYKNRLNDLIDQEADIAPDRQKLFDMDDLYRHTIESIADKVKKSPSKGKKFSRLLSAAIELDPDNAKYHFELGVVRFASGDYAQSIADLKKAADMEKNDLACNAWLARSYFLHRDYRKSLEAMEKIPHVVRLSPELSSIKAKALQSIGRKTQANWWQDHALFLKGE